VTASFTRPKFSSSSSWVYFVSICHEGECTEQNGDMRTTEEHGYWRPPIGEDTGEGTWLLEAPIGEDTGEGTWLLEAPIGEDTGEATWLLETPTGEDTGEATWLLETPIGEDTGEATWLLETPHRGGYRRGNMVTRGPP
jgi:hypothetical protein